MAPLAAFPATGLGLLGDVPHISIPQAAALPLSIALLADLTAYYQAHPADAKTLITFGESRPDAGLDASTLAAWTMLANEMLNLDEVLNK